MEILWERIVLVGEGGLVGGEDGLVRRADGKDVEGGKDVIFFLKGIIIG